MANAEKIFSDPDDIFILLDILEYIKKKNMFDYVLIDNAPARNPLLYMSYIASDYIIVPMDASQGSFNGLSEIAMDIAKFRKRNQSSATILGYFLGAYEKTTIHNVALEYFDSIADDIGVTPFKTQIPKGIIATEAGNQGVPIYDLDKKSKVAKAYTKLTKEILDRINADMKAKED